MAGCVFCRIAADADALVHDTGDVVAFLDHRPLFPGHLLVTPRAHLVTLDKVPTDLLAPLFGVVQEAMRALAAELGAEGTFVAANNVVSQSVPHLHVHVVPRRRSDGLRGFFWPRTGYRDEAHRRDVHQRLAARLAAAGG